MPPSGWSVGSLSSTGSTPGAESGRAARTAARERAWALAGDTAPGADSGLVALDLDATIVLFSVRQHLARVPGNPCAVEKGEAAPLGKRPLASAA